MKTLLLVIILISNKSLAKDFGKQGITFRIKEEGFLAMVKRKLNKVDIEHHQQEMIKRSKEKVTTPTLVEGISKTQKPREFFYDPTYKLQKDILLPDGKILHKAGTTVNPLNHMDFDRRLVFIDGRDDEQLAWLKELKLEDLDRVILVAGRPFDVQKDLGKQVYFDQAGELTGRFGIKHVPAILVQDKKMRGSLGA